MDFYFYRRLNLVRISIAQGSAFAIALLMLSCTERPTPQAFFEDFNRYPDRVWISKDFWAVPLEDWQLRDGRVECVGSRQDMRVHLLTCLLDEKKGDLEVSMKIGLRHETSEIGSAGLRIGIHDPEDPDPRAAVYFGDGIDIGVATNGFLFVDENTEDLPAGFDLYDFDLRLTLEQQLDAYKLTATASDRAGKTVSLGSDGVGNLKGLVAVFNKSASASNADSPVQFWFDDWQMVGSKVRVEEKNHFGPILWSMYTLSRGILKLTAQMPPIASEDNQSVELQVKRGQDWSVLASAPIDPDARTATFRIENWESDQEIPFRLLYEERFADGSVDSGIYEGKIRRDPIDRTVVLGGLTCQYGSGFPYSPLTRNLEAQDVDLLYFSGDQIYEANGGYGIIRFPADQAILNYLGKWYMFGWAFGDLMRDRPTICTPDDHDVFQGNIWGEGGQNIPIEIWNRASDDIGGYVQPAKMVNAVHRTQCAHLPDPVDPTPIKQLINVFYTDLLYGRISFAIVSDRMFKSHPNQVASWDGRADHVKQRLQNPDSLDRAGLKLLGERQLTFLEEWVTQWDGADMKVLLSQTPFVNIATHHGGEKEVLYADLDSGGWPQSGRDRALQIMRKGFAFHIVGDQHIPTLSQYGIDDYRDAGWVFCTPAIYVGYQRRFQPERLGWKIERPPSHQLPNTGYYRDGLGNLQYVYAVGNPLDEPRPSPRYPRGQDTASGFGVVRFNKQERLIHVEAYRFLGDADKASSGEQFPGWPHTIHQLENGGENAVGFLPQLHIKNMRSPVLKVIHEGTGELEYMLRIKEGDFFPPVYRPGRFTIEIGEPETQKWKTLTGLVSAEKKNLQRIEIDF